MVVGAARHDAEALGDQRLRQYFGVSHDLPLVLAEIGLERFLKADGLRGDDVHQRASLYAWEDDLIEVFGVLRLREDHATARTAQRLVRGGRNKVRVRERTGV